MPNNSRPTVSANAIPNYAACVRYALEMKGIAGDTFKDTSLRVYERLTANPGTVFTALSKGGIVIPMVSASLFGEDGALITATVVVKANQVKDRVDLYVPQTSDVKTFDIDAFVEAWETAGGFCVTAFQPDAKTYHPKLIDLKHVELPDVFEELREAIAENAHDMWALERQSEGWTYGPQRDDSRLETPDMVPYAQLPESEKQYDRIMAEDTLRLLTALGYSIVRA